MDRKAVKSIRTLCKFSPIVAGTNGVSPIFLTTVGVTGGIGVDLKNWVKKVDQNGKPILNNDGNQYSNKSIRWTQEHF